MSEIIHTSQRGTVEIFEGNGEKRIRRTVNSECPVYEKLIDAECPYIPQIYSVEIAAGKTVVTGEFISGKNLLATNLDEKQILRAMVQLCTALDCIHGLGIVHRDIKPSNILIDEDGNIRLIDFEAARFVSSDKDKDTCYLGTDGFAPPEQYGFSQTDFRSDIYAAGQTMKILLGSLSAKARYAKIIKKCSAFDPDKRYQTARELFAALTMRREKISMTALAAALLSVTVFAAFVAKNVPSKNILDGTEFAEETETNTVSETVSTSETTLPTETESISETTVPTEMETTAKTESILETAISTESEITSQSTTVSQTEITEKSETVPETTITFETEASSETKNTVTTAINKTPDNLPIVLNSKEYALMPEIHPYYARVNVQQPVYAWIGNDNGFSVESESYVLKNTDMWIAMYADDYLNNDIFVNGEVANAVSSSGSRNFGILYTIDSDESEISITSKPTAGRKSVIVIKNNDVGINYYVNNYTSGGNINSGDTVRFGMPVSIICYKNLIAGYDITVNGEKLPMYINGDNTYMLGMYTPNSQETVIDKVKRNKLTEYERTNFIPVYFSGGIRVVEFPFSDGMDSNEWRITYETGAIIEKGSKIRIAVYPSDIEGKELKIHGSVFYMNINGDGSSYLFDYIIPSDAEALNITLE